MQSTYTVRPGDSMWAIAQSAGVSLMALEHANPQETNPDLIHPGDVLTLPGHAGAPHSTPAARPTAVEYTIESGDTLSAIADRYHTSVGALAAANGISNPNLIVAGAHLRITAAGAAVSRQSLDAPAGSPAANAQIVAAVAREDGLDPVLAVQVMLVESQGDNRAQGDYEHGSPTSFGLFQLHEGGELTGAGLTASEAFDPATNARVAVGIIASTAHAEAGTDPGWIAANAQRPADRADYAKHVDGERSRALALLGE